MNALKNSETVLFIVEFKNKLVFQKKNPDVQVKLLWCTHNIQYYGISNAELKILYSLFSPNHEDLSKEIEKHYLEKKTIPLCGGFL